MDINQTEKGSKKDNLIKLHYRKRDPFEGRTLNNYKKKQTRRTVERYSFAVTA